MKQSFCGGSIFKESARLAFDDAQCVMSAERTMKHLKHVVRGNNGDDGAFATNASICLKWIFQTWRNITRRDLRLSNLDSCYKDPAISS